MDIEGDWYLLVEEEDLDTITSRRLTLRGGTVTERGKRGVAGTYMVADGSIVIHLNAQRNEVGQVFKDFIRIGPEAGAGCLSAVVTTEFEADEFMCLPASLVRVAPSVQP